MGFIRVVEKSKVAKKKPGWQKAAAEYAEWQSKIAGMTSGITGLRQKSTLPKAPKVQQAAQSNILPARYVVGSGTKEVARPELLYRDNPELLARELAARERKFNVAPAYNKGGDVYVTEEELTNQLRSNKRRS